MLVNFVWDEGQNILIFVGKAHATVVAGILFKLAIEGRLKTVISGLPGCNPCFQTTLVMSRKVAWALPARNYSGLTLNQGGVTSPCRTICTVCGFGALS
ncbi:hypothetical protein [Neisseria sp. HMSC70E02]|uniref:hypothetical protein n=1 Tax=Neisseria sp. HMSC70E02 TaxID=1608896 RepID=UPI00143C5DE3